MFWYVSGLVDSGEEIKERMAFYSGLTKLEMTLLSTSDYLHVFNDNRNDNLCMIIGHTDEAFNIINSLKQKSSKKYRFYLCICEMEKDYLQRLFLLSKNDTFLICAQKEIEVEGKTILCCEFINKEKTQLGFMATRSELMMFNHNLRGFHNKLDKGFKPITIIQA